MGEVINLNKYRKYRARVAAESTAAENRRKHGRSKADKEAERARADKAMRMLEQHWLLKGTPPSDDNDS
ncbi:MAG: DUF4169 family protein [Myxococcales bacterium]|nr:DUF4169 family protein [Myxococcales bacterium]MDD9970346.1 DUF4169 family protein [Myxococcales bacterium]